MVKPPRVPNIPTHRQNGILKHYGGWTKESEADAERRREVVIGAAV